MTDSTGNLSPWGERWKTEWEVRKAGQRKDVWKKLYERVVAEISNYPELSNNKIAQRLGCTPRTVSKVRRGMPGFIPRPANSEKTHCPAGHPYDESNTYRNPKTGDRQCRECHRQRVSVKYAADSEAGRKYSRKMYALHGDKDNALRRQQRKENGEEIRLRDRKRYEKNPARKRQLIYMSRTGIRWDEWEALWKQQEGCCYLCGELLPLPPENGARPQGTAGTPHLDHDHRCCPGLKSCPVCRRGLAHSRCNALIGLAGEDPELLRQIATALEAARAIVEEKMRARLTLGDYHA